MSSERLQKILSQAGLGSRREMERWIADGLVEVNGAVAALGSVVDKDDTIRVKGQPIQNPLNNALKVRILLYHKPVGEISSRRDPKFSNTVFDRLPHIRQGRWIQVGRLDLNTSGLLLFTNDGALANRLMHPRYQFEREYAVRVYGEVTKEVIRRLLQGVMLEDGLAKFTKIESRGGEGKNSWYHVTLTEGRQREVRRLWESQELEVSRLIRIRYGSVVLPRSLSRGEFVEMSTQEVTQFMASLQ